MKTLFLLLSCLFASVLAFSQPYGNEWIDYEQPYYKFQSEHNGLVRISFEALEVSGIDLLGADFKLMSGGEEIPIYVSTDGVFQMGDYIEFYGNANDGEFDTALFFEADHQVQDRTSLFSSLRTYFLLSDSNEAHLRYAELENDLAGVGEPEPYFWHKQEGVLNQTFHFGQPYISEFPSQGIYQFPANFSEGEGWVSGIIKETINTETGENIGQVFKLPTPNLYKDGPNAAIYQTTVVGRANTDFLVVDEFIGIELGGTNILMDSFSDFSVQRYTLNLSVDSIGLETDVVDNPATDFKYLAFNGISNEVVEVLGTPTTDLPYETKFSVAYHELTYPHTFHFNDAESFLFELNIDNEKYFEVKSFDGGASPILYDLTTHQRLMPNVFIDAENDTVYQFKLTPFGDSTTRNFYLTNITANTVETIEDLTERIFIDYSMVTSQGDYLLITHEDLRAGAVDEIARYANYRESGEGGNHRVLIVEMEELYDQFAQGINQHPFSIKNFLRFAMDNFISAPAFVNLIGKGITYDKTLNNATNLEHSLVPSYGHQSSDYWLVSPETHSFSPDIGLGRIPANNPEEVKAYLDKLIEYESQGNACEAIPDWKKDFLLLSKGWSSTETNTIFLMQEAWGDTLENASMGLNQVAHLLDETGAIPAEENNAYETQTDLPDLVNNGLGFISYAGHGAPQENYWQFDFQEPNFYENEGKYPVIFSNSSFTGNIFRDLSEPNPMAADYVLTENRGAIAYFASNWFSQMQDDPSYLINYDAFVKRVLSKMTDENTNKSISENIRLAIMELYSDSNVELNRLLEEFVFIGDPALKFINIQEPQAGTFALTNNTFICQENVMSFTTENFLSNDCYEQIYLLTEADSTILEQNSTGEFDLTTLAEDHYIVAAFNYPAALFDANSLESLNQLFLEEDLIFDLELIEFNLINCDAQNLAVWPGDINYDSIANNIDVVYLGMKYGQTGPIRSNASIVWEGQEMNDWSDWQSTAANTKHADCDGNGIVDLFDLDAIDANYRLTHEGGKTAQMGVLLSLLLPDTILAGDTIEIPFILGTIEEQINDFYGIAFSIEFDAEYLEEGSIQFDFNSEFLGLENQEVIGLGKVFYDEGLIEIGLSKIDLQNEDGDGVIGKMSAVMIEDIIGKDTISLPLNFETTKITAFSLDGTFLEVGGEVSQTMLLGTSTDPESIPPTIEPTELIKLQPNPTEGFLEIISKDSKMSQVEVFDPFGRVILNETFLPAQSHLLDVSFVQNGQYYVKVHLEESILVERFIKLN